MGHLPDYNLSLFSFLNDGAGYSHPLDLLVLFITSYATYLVCAVVLAYSILWLPFFAHGIRLKLHRLRQAVEMVISVGVTWCAVEVVKVLVAAPRPFLVLMQIHVLSPYESGYSFPSGHAAITTALASVVYFTYNRGLGVLLYCFALLVSVSRIYVGVHYPIDVMVGILLGFALPALVHLLFNPSKGHVSKTQGLPSS